MQELAPHIYLETAYPGVALGAINWPHGLILVDAPFRAEDARSWRSALINQGGGVDRLLVNLDAHLDRTLGVRAMECTVVGHEKMAQVFRNRPISFKAQSNETGAEWELYNNLGSIRWAPPEITFTHQMYIHWDNYPLLLEHRPGPTAGAIWVVLPEHHIVFIGDAVTPGQPPFLAGAHLPTWLDALQELLSPVYQNYLIVSSRGGLIHHDEIRKQMRFLQNVQQAIALLAQEDAPPEKTAHLVREFADQFDAPPDRAALYQQRLIYGLHQYYIRQHYPVSGEVTEEE